MPYAGLLWLPAQWHYSGWKNDEGRMAGRGG